MKHRFQPALCLLLALLTACAPPGEETPGTISRRPAAEAVFREESSEALLASGDLRGADLRDLDLSGMEDALFAADFDTSTRWPEDLPGDFAPERLLELGKNPGLGLRALHERGVTGKGVGIAIIDQALLYFIADDVGTGAGDSFVRDMTYYAEDVDRLTALNENLPEDEKIRVISMSAGWMPDTPGAEEIEAAIRRARAAGIAVVCVSSRDPLLESWMGMGRRPDGDPDRLEDCRPGAFWEEALYGGEYRGTDGSLLLVPMDCRTAASPAGEAEYAFFAEGGMSWVAPYVAGLYALACQVKPEVTYEKFLEAARATARPVSAWKDGVEYPYGRVVDPAALLEALE